MGLIVCLKKADFMSAFYFTEADQDKRLNDYTTSF